MFSPITISQPFDKVLQKVISAVHSEFVKNADNLEVFTSEFVQLEIKLLCKVVMYVSVL